MPMSLLDYIRQFLPYREPGGIPPSPAAPQGQRPFVEPNVLGRMSKDQSRVPQEAMAPPAPPPPQPQVPVAPRTVASPPPVVPQPRVTSPASEAVMGTPDTQPYDNMANANAAASMLAPAGQGPEGSLGGAVVPPIEAPAEPEWVKALQALKAPAAPEQQRLGAPSVPDLYRGKGGGLAEILANMSRGGGGGGGIRPEDLLYLSKLLGR